MTRINELCKKVKVNRQAYPQFNENFLKATKQEHKVEQCKMAKTNTIVVYNEFKCKSKLLLFSMYFWNDLVY